MASKIDILIKAKDQASAEINKITGSLNGLSTEGGQSTENVGLGFDEMVGVITTGAAIAAAAVAALQKAIEFSREGAEIVRLQDTSASLASSMGFDMDEIVAKVSAASLHTVSDMDIMSSAAKAMMLGVGSSAGEMASLMEVAAIRGRALGLDATEAFDQIVTGIGRLSPKILDNLGIIVDADVTYAAYAESIGKSADELTEMEKRQALVDAVIADTAPLLAETGGLVEDSASKWEQLETAQANFFNSLKADAADMMGWWPDFWIKFYEAMTPPEEANADVINVMGALNDAVAAGIIDMPLYEQLLGDIHRGFMDESEAIELVNQKADALREANGDLAESQGDLIMSLFDATENFDQFKQAAEEAGLYIGILDEETYNAEKALRDAGEAAEGASGPIEEAGAAAGEAAGGMQAVADATNDADEAMKNYSERLLFNIASEGLSEEAALALATAMGLVDQKTVSATQQVNFYQDLLAAGVITQAEYNLLIEQLATDLENVPEETPVEVTTNVEEVLDDLDDLATWRTKPILVEVEVDDSKVRNWQPPSKTGTITYSPVKGGLYAAGGAIHAAASGLAASLSSYWVGERGPEPFFPAIDGRIVSNTQAMAALRGGAGANAREIANAVRDGVREAMRETKAGNVYNLTMPTSSNPADVRTAFELMEAWGA